MTMTSSSKSLATNVHAIEQHHAPLATMVPRWGRVTAQANEFLIQMRDGKVVRAGQGLSCFKWPSDSVAIVPTSIAKLGFAADQVTVEKVGVEVRGLAVYRIAEPLLAYRMIDILDRGALTEILRDMFVGATRRIVASLTLDECIRHRKDQIAVALMEEIAPILAGEGATDDTNSAGWGVVLDTIEIQDVRVLSQEVFGRLQAPYREKLALEALVAENRVVEERTRLEAERRRVAEQSRRELMAEEEARIVAEQKRATAQTEHESLLATQRQEADLSRQKRKAEADKERQQIDLQAKRESSELEAHLLRLHRQSHEDLSDSRLREIMLTETMPELAKAFRNTFDRVHITTTNGNDPFAFLTAGIDHVVGALSEKNGTTKK